MPQPPRKMPPAADADWLAAIAGVKPLSDESGPAEGSQEVKSALRAKSLREPSIPTHRGPHHPDEISGLDPRTLQKLRRGEVTIDAKLDLHGMTAGEAQSRVRDFILGALGRGQRCVLIVTGKGRDGDGILRAELPRWISASPFARAILCVEKAHVRHGGDGAFYVLLRRRR